MVGRREYTSLFLLRIDVDGFIMHFPEVSIHPYVSGLILLISTISILWGLWNLVSSQCKRRQFLGEAILKCALWLPGPGWQDAWKDLGSGGCYFP